MQACEEAIGPLTTRQDQVASLIATGHTDRQIAVTLAISVQRVGQIVDEIAVRLHVDPALDARLQIAARVARASALEFLKIDAPLQRA